MTNLPWQKGTSGGTAEGLSNRCTNGSSEASRKHLNRVPIYATGMPVHLISATASASRSSLPMLNGHREKPTLSASEPTTAISNLQTLMAPRPSTLSVRSPLRFVLGNFFLAVFLISLVISTTFFAVAWFTVFRDARSMNHQVVSNVTGVSLHLHYNEWTSLTTVVTVGVDTRPCHSTRSRCICIIHFMESRRLWFEHHSSESVLGRRSRPRSLRAIQQDT